MKANIIGLSLLSLFFGGCSSKVVKTDELKQVQRVAIIGFDMQQRRSVSAGDLLSIATNTSKASSASLALGAEAPRAEQAYNELSKSLAAKTKWKVISIEELRKNSAYIAFFKSKTEGFQNRPIINDRIDLIRPTGVLDNFAIMTADKKVLVQLAKELSVDAIVSATTTIELNANGVFASMVGKGEYKPSGKTTIRIKDARMAEDMIMLSAEGPKVDKGEKNTLGMSNEEKLNALAVEATNLSTSSVLNEFPSLQ